MTTFFSRRSVKPEPVLLFLKAKRPGTSDRMGDLFGANLTEQQIQHKGYTDTHGVYHKPHMQSHHVRTDEPKPVSSDARGLDRPETYANNPGLATLARKLAEKRYAELPAGTIGRGDLKREFLAGKHADIVAAALDGETKAKADKKAAAKTRAAERNVAKDAAEKKVVVAAEPAKDLHPAPRFIPPAPAGYKIQEEFGAIGVFGPFDNDLHSRIKKIGGVWDGASRHWVVKMDKGRDLGRAIDGWTQSGGVERVQQSIAEKNRAEISRWLGYVVDKAAQGYVYDKGVQRLRELGADKDPAAAVQIKAAIDRVASIKAARAEEKSARLKDEDSQGEKIYLDVPYAEKWRAKDNGAKWDPGYRQWYIRGNVPDALKQYAPQKTKLAPGESLVFWNDESVRQYRVGDTFRDKHGQAVTIESVTKKWFNDEDSMTFAGMADAGYAYTGRARPATESETRQLVQKEREAKRAVEIDNRVKKLKTLVKDRGTVPDGRVTLTGEHLFDSQNIYGGGDWFVIEPDAIWYVQNNGRDGDDWSLNNVRTGGAGAIGWKMPYEETVANAIRDAWWESGEGGKSGKGLDSDANHKVRIATPGADLKHAIKRGGFDKFVWAETERKPGSPYKQAGMTPSFYDFEEGDKIVAVDEDGDEVDRAVFR